MWTIFIAFIIITFLFLKLTEPITTRIAQYLEQKRVERELEIERLEEENYNRYYQEYLERKKNRKK